MEERIVQIRALCAALVDEELWESNGPRLVLLARIIVPELCDYIEKLNAQIDKARSDLDETCKAQADNGKGEG
jgi:hypothetical protein